MPVTDGTTTEFKAIVVSANDYYPFGMVMEGRKYRDETFDYRYGFNGKEDDKDFGDKQLIQDYGFRLYNPAIARFLSVDPLAPDYPELTVYQFASNTPIWAIDLDGLEMQPANILQYGLGDPFAVMKTANDMYTYVFHKSNVWYGGIAGETFLGGGGGIGSKFGAGVAADRYGNYAFVSSSAVINTFFDQNESQFQGGIGGLIGVGLEGAAFAGLNDIYDVAGIAFETAIPMGPIGIAIAQDANYNTTGYGFDFGFSWGMAVTHKTLIADILVFRGEDVSALSEAYMQKLSEAINLELDNPDEYHKGEDGKIYVTKKDYSVVPVMSSNSAKKSLTLGYQIRETITTYNILTPPLMPLISRNRPLISLRGSEITRFESNYGLRLDGITMFQRGLHTYSTKAAKDAIPEVKLKE